MRPLLWKEFYALRGWLLAGAALTGGLELLLATHVFGGGFVSAWMEALMPLVSAAVAIALAAGQIARERHSTTLDFLLTRPVSANQIVWSKFLAGAAVLSLLMAGIVALGYADPDFKFDTGLQLIREQVSAAQLFAAMLPRTWFLYAAAFLFSLLVDRPVKAVSLAAVVAITAAATAVAFSALAPFSGFVFWLPFFDDTGGLVLAARSATLTTTTGLGFIAAALALVMLSAALLKRSPERYLATRGLIVTAALVIGAAYAAACVSAARLPVTGPLGSWQIQSSDEPAKLLADESTAAVVFQHHVQFLDFSQPDHPRQTADIEMPLWTSGQGRMAGGVVILTGQKKQVPVDDAEIAFVAPTGVAEAISLGPVRPGDWVSDPAMADDYVFVGFTRDRVCSLIVFDRRSREQVASLLIDRMRPAAQERALNPVWLLRRGNYLYVSSPSYLSTIDISHPAQPRVTSQLPARPTVSLLYGFSRQLAWQGDRLLKMSYFPQTVTSYSLRDPAQPVPGPDLVYRGGGMEGSGRALYKPWEFGLMEFRASGNDFHAIRYLKCENVPSDLAVSGGLVYALTEPREHKPRFVQVFR